jgi:hydrophobic/amphiphilic exporter-1 (mainly G- bacteria), HAE1 family
LRHPSDSDDFVRVHSWRTSALLCNGAGKIGRHSVGTAIVGGMLFSTVLNLFFIPVLHVIKTLLVSLSKEKVVNAPDEEVSEAA